MSVTNSLFIFAMTAGIAGLFRLFGFSDLFVTAFMIFGVGAHLCDYIRSFSKKRDGGEA
ncbi:hypothetical protein [Rhizobium sp. 2MFCol3.1]|uniref:hypothetical protein n=1 Tax=Rhizobium sp. 2MFCol3.1 TaxID=1246459 RepID=UPI00036028F0|nr:hypothetical protein [Rhizobium sp. 2MFCol3.1]